jgi:hypothetical protein
VNRGRAGFSEADAYEKVKERLEELDNEAFVKVCITVLGVVEAVV